MTGEDRPVALVTGGSRGIGRAVVTRLAESGFDVAFCYRSESRAAVEVAEQAVARGAAVHHEAVDVADPDGVEAFVEHCRGALGPVSAAVTCAGVISDGPLVRMERHQWTDVIATNLSGTYHVCRSLIGSFMRGGGSLVTMSSVSGLHGNANQCNYAASKAGIIGLTRSVAREYGRFGVRANTVVPGFITTDMTEAVPDRVRREVLDRVPLRRPGTPAEVADLVEFLVSARSTYVTGQVMGVDGGLVV